MIADQEIDTKAKEFGLKPIDVEKDYIHGWLLRGIYTRSSLGASLILKGGNALRKAYLPNTRFSKDLDFSLQQTIHRGPLENELKMVCDFVERQTGVQFAKDKTIVKSKELPFGIDALEARLYFRGFYGDENLTLKTQLDITQFDKIYLPVQERRLLHPYSDIEECGGTIRSQQIEEILASKLTTLLHRRKAIDLFDLLYSIVFRDEFPVNRASLIATFLKKSIFEPNPFAAKGQLLALPLDEFRPLWSGITAPISSLFSFEYVIANFSSLIESLFGSVLQHVSPVFSRIAGFGGSSRSRLGTQSSIGGSPSYFSWNVRNAIVAAGRARTLVELVYGGWRRLVEPYKIEYYIRKSDGAGSEYFWGYDTTGGKTGPSIKSFFCDKIQSARLTDISFIPREQIEL